MAWIRTIDPSAATGLLKGLYDEAVRRAGRVFQVIRLQSLHPRVLQSSTRLYLELMRAPDNVLTRAQREMIATVVSRENDCFY
jgi:alkylhydroperoxidase family enzyme